mmetsp:Transcript_8555/g.12756  ORF Transcript_8555/g.12756 Transcript_8555/m.12756 type:complete len:256 (+) Transcript_8555:3-770(+)
MSEEHGAKRARRSKWDAPEPVTTKPAASTISTATSLPPTSSSLPLVNTPENIIAQQAALQKSLALRQSLVSSNPLLSGLAGVALGTVTAAPGLQHRVYIGSIHYDIKESDIVALFSSFGQIMKSEMSMDSQTGRSKGFCFLEYADPASASAAQAMDGFELAGRKIKVGRPFHGQGALNSPTQSLNTMATVAALGQQLQPTLLPQANQFVRFCFEILPQNARRICSHRPWGSTQLPQTLLRTTFFPLLLCNPCDAF